MFRILIALCGILLSLQAVAENKIYATETYYRGSQWNVESAVRNTPVYRKAKSYDVIITRVLADFTGESSQVLYFRTEIGNLYDSITNTEPTDGSEYTEAIILQALQEEFFRFSIDIWAMWTSNQSPYEVIGATPVGSATRIEPLFCVCGTVTITDQGGLTRDEPEEELP